MSVSFMPSPPDHVPPELMVDFDYFTIPEGVSDPIEVWRDLVRRGVPDIFYTRKNGGHWVFLRYDDIVEAYRNDGLFSTHCAVVPAIEPFPVMPPQGVDPPEHNVFRKLMAPLFTPIAIKGRTEEIRGRVRKLIGKFKAEGTCDFVADYAGLLPTSLFLRVMGMPEERLPEFKALTDVFFRSADDLVRKQNAIEISILLDKFMRERMEKPENDLASLILTAKGLNGEEVPYEDKLNCAFLMFVAGLDTVTNTMAYIWRYLATTPDAREYFRRNLHDHDKMQFGIEELLRINPVSNLFRRCKSDFVYKGIQFKQNDRVVMPNNLANCDPRVFERPEEIMLGRTINNHVTFGVGPHRCIGSHLAKLEIYVSLVEWFTAIPEFELTKDVSKIRPFGGHVMGFESLPLCWVA